MKLKVFGGNTIGRGGTQYRTIVAAFSRKAALEALIAAGHPMSMYYMRDYWCETSNIEELAAVEKFGPGVVLSRPLDDFKAAYAPTKKGSAT